MNRSALLTLITTDICAGCGITAATMRTVLDDIAANCVMPEDLAAGTGIVIASSGSGPQTITVTTDATVTRLGNSVNVAGGLVQLDASGKLPAVDASQLLNVPGASITTGTATNLTGLLGGNGSQIIQYGAGAGINLGSILNGGVRCYSISCDPNTVTEQGNAFNGPSQLVQLNSAGQFPPIDGSNLYNLPLPGVAWPAQTVVNGTSGTLTYSQPFAAKGYKKVVAYANNLVVNGAADFSGNGYNGSAFGSVAAVTSPVAQGGTNTAISFDGSTAYVTVPGAAAITGNASRTIAAWIYLNNSNEANLFNYGNGSSSQLCQFAVAASTRCLALYSYGNDFLSTLQVPLNTWTFVAYTYDSATGKQTLYVNGSSQTRTTSVNTAAGAINIGRRYDGQNYMNGRMDELHFYNTALNATQIAALYNSGSGCYGVPAGIAAANLVCGFHWDVLAVTFPTAFTQQPYVYGDAAAIATVTAAQLRLAALTATSGNIFVEGY